MPRVHVLAFVGLVGLAGCSGGEATVQNRAGQGGGAGVGAAMGGASGDANAGGTGASAGTGAGAGGTAGGGAGGAALTSGGAGGSSAGTSSAGTAGAAGAEGGAGGASSGGAGSSAGGATASGGAGAAGAAGGGGNPLAGMPTEDALDDLDTVRQEHGVAALDGEVYVVGGYTPQATDSVRAYDPETMTWRDVAAFPGPFNHANVGAANGKLFVLGFFVGGDQRTANAQSYSFDGTDWAEVEPLPVDTQRAAACVASLGDDIYVFGGSHGSRSVAHAAVYDAAGDSWTVLPDMPVARDHCVAGAIGGKLYIAGGRTDTIEDLVATTLEFDPLNPGYVEKAPMPTPRGGMAGAVLGGRLFVFGGEGSEDDPDGVFPDIESYDPSTDEWETHPPMKVPRHGMGAAEVGGRIYIPAGANRQGGAAVDDVSVFYFE